MRLKPDWQAGSGQAARPFVGFAQVDRGGVPGELPSTLCLLCAGILFDQKFQTALHEVIQSIWNILIDGLLESYGCDPCSAPPTGACCNARAGACVELYTVAECTFPGTEWLGEGSARDDCS